MGWVSATPSCWRRPAPGSESESLPWLLLVAALLGLAMALVRARPIRADTAVPFGPPLALSFWGLLVAQFAG